MGRKKAAIPALMQGQVEAAQRLSPTETRHMLAALASSMDNPLGFECFYNVVFDRPLPPHARVWIEQIYANKAAGKGTLVKAFRGSTKTTTITIAFIAFRIGHEPQRANLLIQVGDDIAADTTSAIASIIANNQGWRMTFPDVVPDREKGWGAGGYEVKRTDIEYEEWRHLNSQRKDPTLLGVGYKSREIIGKHPDGVLAVDDIHDENNTSSEKELANVIKIVTGTIFPTIVRETWAVFVGTPWTKNDTLAYVESTGEFGLVSTPVYRVVTGNIDEEAPGITYAQLGEQQVALAWPERYGLVEIMRFKALGRTEFARMYLLDLEAASNQVFKYFSYPHAQINTASWIGGAGVDYASTNIAFVGKTGKRDEFAMVYAFAIPGGGLVIFDGVADHLTQAEGEQKVETAQNMFPHWRGAAIEGDGKGEEFINLLYRKPYLKIVPMKTGGKGKERRLVRQLAPWLESGRVRISDAETPFLAKLRGQLDDYPLVEHDDCLDGLYWVCRLFPDVLAVPSADEELPPVNRRKRNTENPFKDLANA